jgi:hypothetical protein
MKNLIYYLILISVLSFSCKKTPIEPIVGVTPDVHIIGDGKIEGTKWLLIQYRNTAYIGSTTSHDTITFVNNVEYKINSGSLRTYNLSPIVGSTNKSLQLNFFTPFGGSNYTGNVGRYFISDGVINACQFTDNQNSSLKFLAWFEKL